MNPTQVEQSRFHRLILCAVLPPLLLMGVLAGFLLWQVTALLSVFRSVERVDQAIVQANRTHRLLVDQETGLRGYLVAGDGDFLEPYLQARVEVEPSLAELERLVADQPVQAQRVEELRAQQAAWSAFAGEVMALRADGREYQPLVRSRRGKRLMDRMREVLASFIREEELLRQVRVRAEHQSVRGVLASEGGLTLLLGVVLALLFWRLLLRVSQTYGSALREQQASEEQFRLLVEGVKDCAMYRLDLNGRVVSWNAGAERLKGYEAQEIIGQHYSVFHHSEDTESGKPEQALAAAAADGYIASEGWRVRKDGSRFWAEVLITALPDESGQLCGFSKVTRDATKRRQAEVALRWSEERFRALVQNSADVILILEADGSIAYVSPSVHRVLGCPPESLITTSFFKHLHPDDRTKVRNFLASATETGASIGPQEFRLARADGDWSTFEALGQDLLQDPRVAGVVLNCRDITQREQAEAALRESQALFRDFMDHSPALAFIRSGEGRLVYVNAAYERFFGTSSADLEGRTLTEVVPEATARELGALYERVLTEHQPLQACHSIPSADGQPHDCQFYLFPITNAAGQCVLGGFALDVSDQRLLEEQLRQAQKMEAVGRLAGGVAHDFNNMLAVIIGYSDLLLDRLATEDPMRDPLGEVIRAGERAADLTRQLLAFSRQQVLEPKRLDVREVVANLDKTLLRLIGEDIEVVVVPCAEPCPVLVDPGQMEQVVLNLAVNARDAMPQGGSLTLETRSVELDEEYVRHHLHVAPGRYVLLSVSDTGCGMDAATRSRIFEPFFTTKGAGEGTGLGLATVYGIVKQSGGDIWVYSEPGKGTTFKVYLPEASSADTAAGTVEALVRPPDGTETILLVEDEPMVRQLVRLTLEKHGYAVLEATRPEEALLLAEENRDEIHLLMTDVVMPGMSGRELAEQLTARRPEMKVLYMSGYTDDAVVRHGVLDAEVAFIQKPFAPSALVRKLQGSLERA